VLARVPYYAAVGGAGAARVRESVLPDITLMFERVRDGRDGTPPDVSESLLRGRTCAAHGVPLAELLKAHRIGGRMMWQAFAEEGRLRRASGRRHHRGRDPHVGGPRPLHPGNGRGVRPGSIRTATG